MRQSGNQVDADAVDPSSPQTRNIVQRGRPVVQPTRGCGFPVNEGLHAQANAVHAALNHRFEDSIVDLPWSALHRDLGVRTHLKLISRRSEKLVQE